MAIRSNRPVYFTKLVLENIRSFSLRQELTLTDDEGRPARWTLIVGDNGVGKTSLLQCMARMCPIFNKAPDEDNGPNPKLVEPEFASEADNDVLDSFVRSDENAEATLEAEFSQGVPLEGKKWPSSGKVSTSLNITRLNGRFTGFDSDGNLSNDAPKTLEEPVVLAYGAGRHPKTTSFDKGITAGQVDSLFKAESALHDAEDLLYRLEFRSLKNDRVAINLLDSLKRMLAEVLPDLDNSDDIEILGPPISASSRKLVGIQVRTPYGKVPLTQLSLGYQTVFAWTVDIAWKLIEQRPDSTNPLHEPAIVIVDEIDLHLHPVWQRNIRRHLTSHFPKVQFIATAHSPSLAQSSFGANLAILRKSKDHCEILNDPAIVRDWRLDQVITSELFGLDSARPPEVARKLERRRELVDMEKLSIDQVHELSELDNFASNLPTAEHATDQDAMDIIRRAAAALSENGDLS